MNFMNLVNVLDVCEDLMGGTTGIPDQIAHIIGLAVTLIQIIVPILLIIWGMLDLGKAVIASKEDEIKKATGALVRRAIAAVVIFLLPTIISFIMTVIGGFSEGAQDDFEVCKACITNPNTGCTAADELWGND